MPRFILTGDIGHAGHVAVDAPTLEEAIDKAEAGDFDEVVDEQGKDLTFSFSGHAEDEQGNELDHLIFTDRETN